MPNMVNDLASSSASCREFRPTHCLGAAARFASVSRYAANPVREAMPRPILIDTDPGTDDAVAILLALAAAELEVLGLVTVAGNLPLALTERNARALLELAGRPEIPVYAGCPRPMGPGHVTAEHAHGTGGLGQLELPAPQIPLRPQHGVDFLIETLRAAAPRSVTICALGPLTNIATALIKAPETAGRMAGLVVMGGASYALGNTTP